LISMSEGSTPAPSRDPPAVERPETILMVEDDPDVRTMGETLLVEAGFAVHTAADADEALDQVRAGRGFDLLFTDIVMPGELDGIGLAAEIGRLRPGTPVLLTTGWADRARDQADQRPDLELIAKPYRQTDLVRKIRLLLDRGAASF
jgi:DNA-binding NtrC family response regulator